jgi:hypothetical protein
VTPEIAGAFFGAFFASIFSLLSYLIIQRHGRAVRHVNAYVHLDRYLNEHLDHIELNRAYIKKIKTILETERFSFDALTPFSLKHKFDTDSLDLFMINLHFSYNRGVERANIKFQYANSALARLFDMYLAKGGLPKENYSILSREIEDIDKELLVLLEEAKKLLCQSRIRIKIQPDPWWLAFFSGCKMKVCIEVDEMAITDERKVLDVEIQENRGSTHIE